MNILNGGSYNNKIAFAGHKSVLDKKGFTDQKFFYPFDSENFDFTVKLYSVTKDDKGNYSVDESKGPVLQGKLDSRSSAKTFSEKELQSAFGKDDRFAYRFEVLNKKNGAIKYAFDPGVVTNINDSKNTDNKFNIVFKDRAVINKHGKQQLIMIDQYYPGLDLKKNSEISANDARKYQVLVNLGHKSIILDPEKRKLALESIRNHANHLGGNLAGVIYKLPEIAKQGYTRIVGLPITSGAGSHLYWTHNAYQMSQQLGDFEDFGIAQREMFKNGVNWVSDAALVNEGLQGIHFSNLLKWGEKSPYYNWFKAPGAVDGSLTIGILPENSKNIRYKLINSPVNLDEKRTTNKDYDKTKPTYVQFYDNRLASADQLKKDERIFVYENKTPSGKYDITCYNDTIAPYSFEVKPDELSKNLDKLIKEKAKDKSFNLQSYNSILKLMNFDHFKISKNTKASGFETWDGNVDIAKLNFYSGAKDDAAIRKLPPLERANAEKLRDSGVANVQDYAIMSGKYWTKLSSDIQTAYVADCLKNISSDPDKIMEKIQEGIDNKQLPESVAKVIDKEVISNVLSQDYNQPKVVGFESQEETVLRNLLEIPLESLPISDDTLAVLSSPYIATRASSDSEVGASRYDIFLSGSPNLPEVFKNVHEQANTLYTDELSDFANDIISGLDMPVVDDFGMVSDFGNYVINQIMPDILKFATVKALDSKANIEFDGEYIDYSKVDPSKTSLAAFNFNVDTPDAEAKKLVQKLKTGVSSISESDKSSLIATLNERLKGVNENSYKIAEAIIDRTESGMGWRIDAAKDVASIDSVKDGSDTFSQAWEHVIKFWKKYNEAVKSENPHAYTTAEITDVPELMALKNGNGRFKNPADAEAKFIQETGINNVANYTYFFSTLLRAFAKDSETGGVTSDMANVTEAIKKNLLEGWCHNDPSKENAGFMYESPLDGVIGSYTFTGNHDKSRMLHLLALDMGLFYSDFSDESHREIADSVLGPVSDYSEISPAAVAMGNRLKEAFEEVGLNNSQIRTAIRDLASGTFKGTDFNPEAFGVRPFEMVIDDVIEQTKFNGYEVPDSKNVKKNVLKSILLPAFDKYYSIYKMLITLPGSATDYAGDKIGLSGYETKAKNYHQQNRNTIRWEWLQEKNEDGTANELYMDFVEKFYDKMTEISDLRTRPELSALNDGVPVGLSKVGDTYPVLRYNDESAVITLYNINNATSDNKFMRKPGKDDSILIDRIDLGKADSIKEGLAAGLKNGTKFVNANDDSMIYTVKLDGGNYYLEGTEPEGKIKFKDSDYNSLVMYKK